MACRVTMPNRVSTARRSTVNSICPFNTTIQQDDVEDASIPGASRPVKSQGRAGCHAIRNRHRNHRASDGPWKPNGMDEKKVPTGYQTSWGPMATHERLLFAARAVSTGAQSFAAIAEYAHDTDRVVLVGRPSAASCRRSTGSVGGGVAVLDAGPTR
jgi:hypothetical protein